MTRTIFSFLEDSHEIPGAECTWEQWYTEDADECLPCNDDGFVKFVTGGWDTPHDEIVVMDAGEVRDAVLEGYEYAMAKLYPGEWTDENEVIDENTGDLTDAAADWLLDNIEDIRAEALEYLGTAKDAWQDYNPPARSWR